MSAPTLVYTLSTALAPSGAAFARPASSPPGDGPAPVAICFSSGSAAVRAQDGAVLDRASRAFNEGHPTVMSLNSGTDRIGSASMNLSLAQQRASAVLRGLVARGIPVDRFQLVAEGRKRRVEITWR